MHPDEMAAYGALMAPGEPLDRLLEAVRARPAWMASAACLGSGVNFFPDAPGRGIPPDVSAAVAICQRCPVVYECREFAEEHDELGIWGNSTPRERRARSAA